MERVAKVAAMLGAYRCGMSRRYQAPLVQNQQVILFLDLIEQMRGPEHADAVFAAQAAHVAIERQTTGRIEADAGFIE
jgi:hypothetical protein